MTQLIIPIDVRPTIIKIAPIIKQLLRKDMDFKTVHTGQHHSKFMNEIFFEDLGIQMPEVNLKVGSGSQAEQFARGLVGLEKFFLKETPELVLVHGDANMVLSAALACTKLNIKLAHKEAGLRSYNREMPEEINRITCDHIADYLFVPTETARKNLEKEGIKENVWVVGNTIVDAIYSVLDKVKKIDNEFTGDYFLLTLHRAENVDNKNILKEILIALKEVYKKYEIPIIYPIHPRTQNKIKEFGFEKLVKDIKIVRPIGYLKFLKLIMDSKLTLTDSGGVQEETCTLGVPCVTIRTSTERPETVDVGSNYIAGTYWEGLIRGVDKMIGKRGHWKNPYGDGKTAERIVKIISEII